MKVHFSAELPFWSLRRFVPPHPGPLPQGEEATSAIVGHVERSTHNPKRDTILPLPKGEGRGEGKEFAPPPTVSPITPIPLPSHPFTAPAHA